MAKKAKGKSLMDVKKLPFVQRVYLQFYIYFALRYSSYKEQLVESLNTLKKGLAVESEQTKKMFEIYVKYTRGEASKRELKEANHQFQDVLKSLGLGTLIILPFSPVTLPLVIKLGRYFGVELVPDAFQSNQDRK